MPYTKRAIAHPRMVDKLVLLCPAGVGTQKTSFAFMALFNLLLGEKGMDRLYRKVNGGKPIPQVMIKYQKLIGKKFNFRRAHVPLFSDAELTQLTMPSALFVGLKDVMFHSLKTAQRYRSLVPNAKVNVLQEAGHTLIDLMDDILSFLQK
ncbi:alpha/beta fold hydrolase [Paenibacillus koleovorans]|uniref:alpha/beta fold hydrolase n=1 Tax=Paenibacillus koleovorans TaxID=121608 RepID=UPI001C3FF41A|nr:hypothetical protein [Paenibacillus koleovorans]